MLTLRFIQCCKYYHKNRFQLEKQDKYSIKEAKNMVRTVQNSKFKTKNIWLKSSI